MKTQYVDKLETLKPIGLSEAVLLDPQTLRKYFSKNMLVRVLPVGKFGKILAVAGWTYWDYMLLYGLGTMAVSTSYEGSKNCNFGQNLSAKVDWKVNHVIITHKFEEISISRRDFDSEFSEVAGEILEALSIFSGHSEFLEIAQSRECKKIFGAASRLESILMST
jgi:hypothetical protein